MVFFPCRLKEALSFCIVCAQQESDTEVLSKKIEALLHKPVASFAGCPAVGQRSANRKIKSASGWLAGEWRLVADCRWPMVCQAQALT